MTGSVRSIGTVEDDGPDLIRMLSRRLRRLRACEEIGSAAGGSDDEQLTTRRWRSLRPRPGAV